MAAGELKSIWTSFLFSLSVSPLRDGLGTVRVRSILSPRSFHEMESSGQMVRFEGESAASSSASMASRLTRIPSRRVTR